MKKPSLLACLALAIACIAMCIPYAHLESKAAATAAITRALDNSAAAWNRGDIRAFMDCYDNSPETAFVGKTVTRGWQPVMDHYLTKYTTPEQMGHLDFSDLQVRVLDRKTAAEIRDRRGSNRIIRPAAGNRNSIARQWRRIRKF